MLRDRITPFLEDIVNRRVTNRAVALRLQVSEEHVSRTLKELHVIKVPAERRGAAQKELVAARYAYRQQAAKTLTPRQAARAANCSIRTIYRWKNK